MNSSLDRIPVPVRAFGTVRQAPGASELQLGLPAGAAALGPASKGDAGPVHQWLATDLALGCRSPSVYSSAGLSRNLPCRPSLVRPSIAARWRRISLGTASICARLGERRSAKMWDQAGRDGMAERAQPEAERLLATHQVRPLTDEQERELDTILARAESKLKQ